MCPQGSSSWEKVGGRQEEASLCACVGGRVTAGMRVGFKLRSVEYAATGYFFFSVSWDGS